MGKYIHSVHQLELLLFLKRYPERNWPVQDLADELYSNPQTVETALTIFVRAGFVIEVKSSPRTFRYQPKDPKLDGFVTELLVAYRDYRVRVIELIFATRRHTVQEIADAFRMTDKLEDD